VIKAQRTTATDTTPAFIQAGLLSALHGVFCRQNDELDVSFVLQIMHALTHTSFGARTVLSDEGLCQPVVKAAVAEISKWCGLQPQLRTDMDTSTAEAAMESAHATGDVTQAVLIIAQLLEAGIDRLLTCGCNRPAPAQ
jgi:hypothetical protein